MTLVVSSPSRGLGALVLPPACFSPGPPEEGSEHFYQELLGEATHKSILIELI